jgi:hypothetical protein
MRRVIWYVDFVIVFAVFFPGCIDYYYLAIVEFFLLCLSRVFHMSEAHISLGSNYVEDT